jgi:hypothetical protein
VCQNKVETNEKKTNYYEIHTYIMLFQQNENNLSDNIRFIDNVVVVVVVAVAVVEHNVVVVHRVASSIIIIINKVE